MRDSRRIPGDWHAEISHRWRKSPTCPSNRTEANNLSPMRRGSCSRWSPRQEGDWGCEPAGPRCVGFRSSSWAPFVPLWTQLENMESFLSSSRAPTPQ
eukprot:10188439-Lingulodinium_polyedra.AAC.1